MFSWNTLICTSDWKPTCLDALTLYDDNLQCTVDYSGGGGFYFRLTSRRSRAKEVQVGGSLYFTMTLKLTFWCTHQVIPWLLSDSNFVRCTSQRLDPSKTVFVGALHGGSPMHAIKWPFCSLLTRSAHCWRFGPSVCRLVWRCCLCWHWHWQIQVSNRFSDFSARHLPVKMNYRNQKQNVLNQNVQVPHWKWPCYLQQCQVLHEGCGRCFHWDQDCQVHQEGFTLWECYGLPADQ